MKNIWRRLVALTSAVLLLVSSFVYPVYADAPTWCKVYVNQTSNGVGHIKGCTTVTLQLILQNSGTLTSEWQLDGAQTKYEGGYAKFDKKCAGNGEISGINDYNGPNSITGDGVYWTRFPSVAKTVCRPDVTWEAGIAESTIGGQGTNITSSFVVGLGSKDFRDMTLAEQVAAMKFIWASGYWVACGIFYEGYGHTGNGPMDQGGKYRGNHWVMLAGVDDSDVYFNDPATGGITKLSTAQAYGHKYHLVHLLLIKNNVSTPASVSGGQVQFSQADASQLSGMGLSNSLISSAQTANQFIANGTFGDAALSSMRLVEANLNEMLDIISPDSLKQDDLEMLEGWKTNIDADNNEWGFISILRWLVSLVGILITIWGLLVYLAFWFDHINSFFYIDLLHILTFGQLHICPSNEKPTFSMGKDVKNKTVSHKQILVICISAIVFGSMLISGFFYDLVGGLVRTVQSFLG